jgi:hypothetical protein
MLQSVLQISPEMLNNITETIPSSPANPGILEASVTFLVGLLIFLTLRWQLDPEKVFWNSEKHVLETRLDRDIRLNIWFLIGMFVSASISVGLALFPETGMAPRVSFFVSLAIVVAFIIHIIRNPPKRGPQENDDESLVGS